MDPVGAFDQLTIEDPDDPVGNFFSTIWFDTEWHKVKGYCDPHAESYDSIHDYPDVRIPQSVLGDRRWSPEQIDARGDELCHAFIAENPAHFVDHVLYIMVQRFMITDEATGRSRWCGGGSPGEEQAYYEFMAGVRNFHSLDRDEGFNARVPGGDWNARFSQHTFLFHCWNVYRNKLAEEFRVLDGIYNEGDNFVRLVADAIARMPNVETVTFSDHSHDQPWILKYRDTRNKFTQEPLFDLFTRGSNWDNARNLPSAGSQNRCLLLVCMDSTKLKGFLGNRPLWITELHKPHMSFGTWTEALDVMREKYDTEWSRPNKWGKVDDKLKGLNIGGRLWEASGAECSTMTRMAYARAFSIPPGGWPKINGKYSHEGFWQAQHYISHEQDVNPCRDV
ncbi:hypothetical protein K4K55_005284 [Colletotrichum sp. SAR 10_96]|nr:hypothetical protein K4K55_005284 [Colletotrichum sp. SAR 10_96]